MHLPKVVESWVNTFQGSMNVNEYLELFTDDVEFRDGESGRSVRGKSELRKLVHPFTQLSGMSAEVLGYAVNGDTVFLERELKAKAPTGASVTTRGVAVFRLAGPKISSAAMYMFRQNIDLLRRVFDRTDRRASQLQRPPNNRLQRTIGAGVFRRAPLAAGPER